MKVDVEFLVVRKNNNIIQVYPLEDQYTEVALKIDTKDMGEEGILHFYRYLSRPDALRKLADCLEKSIVYEEQEAKDFCGKYGNIDIEIISKEVEIN